MDECTLWSRIMQQLRDSCSASDGLWIKRRRVFNTEIMLRGLLHLVSGGQKSYFQALDQLDLKDGTIPAASSFCEARAKLPSFIIGDVRRDILDLWDDSSSAERWHGHRLHAVDGTKVALPRTLFEYGFRAPAGGHCPQALVSALVRLVSYMIEDTSPMPCS